MNIGVCRETQEFCAEHCVKMGKKNNPVIVAKAVAEFCLLRTLQNTFLNFMLSTFILKRKIPLVACKTSDRMQCSLLKAVKSYPVSESEWCRTISRSLGDI